MRTLTRTGAAGLVETMAAQMGNSPWAYYSFPNGTLTSTPFLIYYFDGNDDFKADNMNYTHIENLVIELYTERVDFESEGIIESVLNNNFMNYSKTFSFIESDEMYLTRYESEVLINGE